MHNDLVNVCWRWEAPVIHDKSTHTRGRAFTHEMPRAGRQATAVNQKGKDAVGNPKEGQKAASAVDQAAALKDGCGRTGMGGLWASKILVLFLGQNCLTLVSCERTFPCSDFLFLTTVGQLSISSIDSFFEGFADSKGKVRDDHSKFLISVLIFLLVQYVTDH